MWSVNLIFVNHKHPKLDSPEEQKYCWIVI